MEKEIFTNDELSEVAGGVVGTDAGGGMTREKLDARLTSVGVYDPQGSFTPLAIVVSSFRSKGFGLTQEVKAWDR